MIDLNRLEELCTDYCENPRALEEYKTMATPLTVMKMCWVIKAMKNCLEEMAGPKCRGDGCNIEEHKMAKEVLNSVEQILAEE